MLLFCATHASIVTSATATPALPAVNNKIASRRCSFSCNANESKEITPRRPGIEKKHEGKLTDISPSDRLINDMGVRH